MDFRSGLFNKASEFLRAPGLHLNVCRKCVMSVLDDENLKVKTLESKIQEMLDVDSNTNEEVVEIGLGLADGSIGYEEILEWIKNHR